MLIDTDSKPKDTVLYLAAKIYKKLKEDSSFEINELDIIFNKISPNQPSFKFYLALSFLFLIDEIEINGNEVRHVPS